MIRGEVQATREAVIGITLRGPTGTQVEIDTVIDTGFTDYLAIAPNLVASLSLSFDQFVDLCLADGSVANVEAYQAILLWEGAERVVLAYAMDGGALLGMSTLYGSRVTLDVVDGGPVRIEALT